ncbi:hypothetical protein CANCADRAFT_27526 [Tortispora caseinolytica NRRL Y-17796]|uniref:Thioesterase domain-containing protein n=1 Tax=Tortispora caseinolytica NRRL Y-17796 TaxID=767744 RepID=A0A1E4TCI6_9ASCO|nr:hypothetical protein CANCADRAFT_27526 [Tortispora caseinolytica NRRL Y-17796]
MLRFIKYPVVIVGATIAGYYSGVSASLRRQHRKAPEEHAAYLEDLPPTLKPIAEQIDKHPIFQSLKYDSDYRAIIPAHSVPESLRPHMLTASTLLGPGKISVAPMLFLNGSDLVGFYHLGPDLCGHPGIVHGGLLATLLDEGLARCAFQALPKHIGVTARLTLNYKAPTPADAYVILNAKVDKIEGRKCYVSGTLSTLGTEKEPSKILVEADALIIQPKWAAALPPMNP